MRVVIVGNGVAGIEAALTLRAKDRTAAITLVSEESDHFFSRTALMYVLAGQMSHRDIEPHARDLYDRLRLERVRARAIGLDSDQRLLHLAGGLPPLPYDRLLIACGSRPRPAPWPGASLRGVGHFVTLQDLEWLEHELDGAPRSRPPRHDAHLARSTPDSPYVLRRPSWLERRAAPKNPVVIGGGLIGIEVIETLLARGYRPLFLIREDWFWPVALDHREAAWVASRLIEHGVEVRLLSDLDRLEGDTQENISRIVLKDGQTHACDLAVVTIGVVPNTGWLQDSGLELENGAIVVDQGLAASAPGVFAAGDCAAVLQRDGRRRAEQLWYTARDQGRIAGQRLAGETASYARGTWYNSAKLMDLEYTTAGLVPQARPGTIDPTQWYFEERGKVRSTTRFVTEGGVVTGFNALGRRWDHSVLCRWIEERRPLAWVLQHLSEAAFDTEFVPPLILPPEQQTVEAH